MFPAFALICKCKPVFHTPEMTNIRVAAVTAPLKMCKGLKKKINQRPVLLNARLMKFTPEPIKQDFFKRVSNYTALSSFNSIHRDFKWKKF